MKEADVILHVRDIASEDSAAEAADVRTVLDRLGVDVAERNVIEVWNKADLVRRRRPAPQLDRRRAPAHPPAGAGLGGERGGLRSPAAKPSPRWSTTRRRSSVTRRPAEGAAVAWLYRHGRVMDRIEDDDGGWCGWP